MVTLCTLSTSQQLPLWTLSKTATYNTHILRQKKESERKQSLFMLHLKVTAVVLGTANATG